MAPIKTYIFMHFACDYDNPKSLTKVAFLAMNRSQFLQPYEDEEPPTKNVKFWNLSLTNGFTLKIYDEIVDEIINDQPKPVCLVSRNGHDFNFPILKRELEKLKKAEKLEDTSADKSPRNWFADVLCADSLYIFYDIEQKNKQDTDINEEEIKYTGEAVRDSFFGKDPTPIKGVYKLEEIYRRVVKEPPSTPIGNDLSIKNDIYMLFRISHKFGNEFLRWTDEIQYEFAKVEAKEVFFNKQ